jgi:mono/diheme cytochrome c family protein
MLRRFRTFRSPEATHSTAVHSRALALAVAVLAVAAPACAGDAPAEEDGSAMLAESGRTLYLRHCSSCHGEAGLGDGPVAPELRVEPADLTLIATRAGGRFPAAEVARYIDGRIDVAAHGSREMPVWGRRFGEDIAEDSTAEEVVRGNISVIVDYLRSIQGSR